MSTETSILDLILRIRKAGTGTKETQDDLDKLKKKTEESNGAFGGMVRGLADVKAGFDIASQVIGQIGQVFDATVIKAANWGDEMGDLSQLTGTSVRDTSELAATFELLGIKSEGLTKVIKSMTSQGLQPTMQNIRKLAAEYQAIQDPVEKNEFLFKRFGKQAGDIAEVLGKSTEELDRFTTAARNSGKVIDEETAAKAEKLNQQLAILKQRADGFAISAGNFVIPSIVGLFEGMDELTAAAQRGDISWLEYANRLSAVATGHGTAATLTQGLTTATQDLVHDTDRLTTSTSEAAVEFDTFGQAAYGAAAAAFSVAVKEQEAAKAAQDLKTAEGDLAAAIAGPVGKENQNYIQQQADIRLKMQDVQGQIEILNTKAYLTPAQKTELDGLKTTLGELETQAGKNATAHEEATARIVFGFIQQRLAADGLQDGEISTLAEIGKAWGIYDQATANALTAVDKSIKEHGANATAIIGDVGRAIEGLPDVKSIEIQVHTNGMQIGSEDFGRWTAPKGSGGPKPTTTTNDNTVYGGAQAAGGDYWVTKPTLFLAGEAGPERATFTPAGQTTNMGGVTINVSGAGDPQAVAREVSRILAAQVRGLSSAGASVLGR